MRELLPSVEHRQHRYLSNRAEHSHQPTRQRERRIQGFKSPGYAQRFLATYGKPAQKLHQFLSSGLPRSGMAVSPKFLGSYANGMKLACDLLLY
jgi:hypothetical protein